MTVVAAAAVVVRVKRSEIKRKKSQENNMHRSFISRFVNSFWLN